MQIDRSTNSLSLLDDLDVSGERSDTTTPASESSAPPSSLSTISRVPTDRSLQDSIEERSEMATPSGSPFFMADLEESEITLSVRDVTLPSGNESETTQPIASSSKSDLALQITCRYLLSELPEYLAALPKIKVPQELIIKAKEYYQKGMTFLNAGNNVAANVIVHNSVENIKKAIKCSLQAFDTLPPRSSNETPLDPEDFQRLSLFKDNLEKTSMALKELALFHYSWVKESESSSSEIEGGIANNRSTSYWQTAVQAAQEAIDCRDELTLCNYHGDTAFLNSLKLRAEVATKAFQAYQDVELASRSGDQQLLERSNKIAVSYLRATESLKQGLGDQGAAWIAAGDAYEKASELFFDATVQNLDQGSPSLEEMPLQQARIYEKIGRANEDLVTGFQQENVLPLVTLAQDARESYQLACNESEKIAKAENQIKPYLTSLTQGYEKKGDLQGELFKAHLNAGSPEIISSWTEALMNADHALSAYQNALEAHHQTNSSLKERWMQVALRYETAISLRIQLAKNGEDRIILQQQALREEQLAAQETKAIEKSLAACIIS